MTGEWDPVPASLTHPLCPPLLSRSLSSPLPPPSSEAKPLMRQALGIGWRCSPVHGALHRKVVSTQLFSNGRSRSRSRHLGTRAAKACCDSTLVPPSFSPRSWVPGERFSRCKEGCQQSLPTERTQDVAFSLCYYTRISFQMKSNLGIQ